MLTRYGPLGASSRLRMLQYLPALRASGFDVTIEPLLADAYVRALYEGRFALREVAAGYLRRLVSLWQARRFDVVWVEKELLPWLPVWMERLARSPAVVVDYDDAVFHRYDQHPRPWVRHLLGQRVDAIMRRADLVTVGNAYLAARAMQAGCARVEHVPTVVDLARYPRVPQPGTRDDGVAIGWIGSPTTASYLRMVAPAIERLARERAVRAVAIGARPDQIAGTPFVAQAWNEAAEARDLSALDIGIMPLPDAPWERGKCGYKLIQYMASGLPVVASPVGVNTEIVAHGEQGLFAVSEDDWHAALTRLVDDAEARRRMGKAGRARVEAWYSLRAQAPRVVEILREAVRVGAARSCAA